MKKHAFIFVLLIYLLGSNFKAEAAMPPGSLIYLKNMSSYTVNYVIYAHDLPGLCGSPLELVSNTITLAPWSTLTFYNVTDLNCPAIFSWSGCTVAVGNPHAGWIWDKANLNIPGCGGTILGHDFCSLTPIVSATLTCTLGSMLIRWDEDPLTGYVEIGISGP